MAITNLAYTTSDNSMGGAVLTFAFLIILFAIVATVLYILLFSRPHPRVPARRLVVRHGGRRCPGRPRRGACRRDRGRDADGVGRRVRGIRHRAGRRRAGRHAWCRGRRHGRDR